MKAKMRALGIDLVDNDDGSKVFRVGEFVAQRLEAGGEKEGTPVTIDGTTAVWWRSSNAPETMSERCTRILAGEAQVQEQRPATRQERRWMQKQMQKAQAKRRGGTGSAARSPKPSVQGSTP